MSSLFETLGVNKEILKSLSGMGIQVPTPVQQKVIGPFLQGGDLLVEAPTGTGKTCAFGIPVAQMMQREGRSPQALILSPTRELALQTTEVLRRLVQHLPGIRVAAVYGGENIQRQMAALRQRPQIVVATPGRLVDLLGRGSVDLGHLRMVVLDEADRMLDMGFRQDLNRIMDRVPAKRQTVLLSATMSREIKGVAERYQHRPQTIRIAPQTLAADAITQYFARVQTGQKNAELLSLLTAKQYPLALVFVRTKRRASSLALLLEKKGLRAGALHGNMSQPQRDRMMQKYRKGEVDVLVATDIAARGLDVHNIDAVINYDLPEDSDTYTHRIGRTGRAQHKGIALTFVDMAEEAKVRQIAQRSAVKLVPCGELAAAL